MYGCVEVVSWAAPRPEAGTLLADIDAILSQKRGLVGSVSGGVEGGCEQRTVKRKRIEAFALK